MEVKNDDVNPRPTHVTIRQAFQAAGVTGEPDVRRLPLEELRVDSRYQKEVKDARVRRIKEAFDPNACGILLVSQRSNGIYYVMDGNHRRCAMIELGITHWRCSVATGLTLEQEQRIWLYCQNLHWIANALEQFKSRLAVREPMAVGITEVLAACHVEIHFGGTARRTLRQVKCVRVLEQIYRSGGAPVLHDVIQFVLSVYSDQELEATAGTSLQAFFLLLHIFGPAAKLDRDRLREVLQRVSLKRILRDASALASSMSVKRPAVRLMCAIIEQYNNGLRSRRIELPPDLGRSGVTFSKMQN